MKLFLFNEKIQVYNYCNLICLWWLFKDVCQGLSGRGAGGSANAYRLCRIMSKVCCQ